MTSVQSSGHFNAMKQLLDGLVDDVISRQVVVGTSILVACDGNIIYQRFAGWADRESQLPVESDTLFRLASMTKPLVSAAVLTLVEEGRLDLNAPVTRYLPWFRPKWRGEEQTITLLNLLTHTSGLSCGFGEPAENHPYLEAGVSDGLDMTQSSLRENLLRLAGAELYSRPGTEWRYSLSTDVLGAVLEAVCDTSLNDVVVEKVCVPLGMRDTAFHPLNPNRLVKAYVDNPVRGQAAEPMPEFCILDREAGCQVRYAPQRAFDPAAYQSGGVGMIGNAIDYSTFLEAIRLGRVSFAKEMTRDQIPKMVINRPDTGFGLGFSVMRTPAEDGRNRGTWGWGGLYGTNFWVDPNRKISTVILTNTALEGMSGVFTEQVAKIVCAAS